MSTGELCQLWTEPVNVGLNGIFPYLIEEENGEVGGTETRLLHLWQAYSGVNLNIIRYNGFDVAITDVSVI